MLISCSFVGSNCSKNDFTWHYDFNFGNCFIFNEWPASKLYPETNAPTVPETSNSNTPEPKEVASFGQSHSLQVELFAGLPNFYPSNLNELGITIIVNNRSSFPLLGNSIDISVGAATNIAISRMIVNKLRKPYSECEFDLSDSAVEDSIPLSALYKLTQASNYTYRQIDCFCLCYQRLLLDKCNCYDLAYEVLIYIHD